MSNPVVTIGNSIPPPVDPRLVRDTFSKVSYGQQKIRTYGEGEYDPSYGSFDPSTQGESFYMFVSLDDALSTTKPDVVSYDAWDGLKKTASGFITAVNSVMPKIIIPSTILVDNGIISPNGTFEGMWESGASYKGLFNWELVSLNSNPIADTDIFKYGQVSSTYGSLYISSKAKVDTNCTNVMVVTLGAPVDPPTGDWMGDLVVGGAFVLMLNVCPHRPGTAGPGAVAEVKWLVTLEFGEVKIDINDTGSAEVTIGIGSVSGEMNKTVINLAEGKTKGGPPQQQHINEKDPFVILVYPVWNGLVVSSGIQDARATVFSSSYYVPKLKAAAVLNTPYSSFDPLSPAAIEVDVGSGADSVLVDFGTTLTVTANNCRFDMSYQPCYFSKECWFDEWRLQNDDETRVVTYTYNVYPIWTKNGTSSTLSPAPTVEDSGTPGSITGTHYTYVQWRLQQSSYNRIAGEIFGSILKVTEDRESMGGGGGGGGSGPIKNGNGSFVLTFTGGSAGDPSTSGNWIDYIQSVSTTVNLDGSSGSITVDKFGCAGQEAVATQSIGAITISVTGGYGTTGGSIFQGLAMGISDSRSSEGASCTIPLVGLEKKLDDIALINIPFFDGETLAVVGDFLCRYGGVIGDYSHASPWMQLGVTDDINAVRFEWKAGTTVRAALQDVMDDLIHSYVIRDGVIFFYQLDSTTGLPTTLGIDYKPSYPGTKTIMYDTSPDFEDMRNQIVVLGLEQIPDGQGTEITGLPTWPRLAVRNNIATTPDIPWARTLVRPISGYMDMSAFETVADKLAAAYSVYELIGKTTIPGNANIKPYDQWGEFVIYGVTHNIDLKSKTWTTDLEFLRKTR